MTSVRVFGLFQNQLRFKRNIPNWIKNLHWVCLSTHFFAALYWLPDLVISMGNPDGLGLRLWCLTLLSTIIQLYRDGDVSFIDGENLTTRRKLPTCRKYHITFYRVHEIQSCSWYM